ncbi:hypothetical protein G4B88_008888 [Cannabis sativa]|uniref:Uncharacterized protein n=1 Tax=Cannabis sativa TaxID=3483 RepID=A0A7J6HP60_CANSA|nr:hypothetical protein G4B88_008888 [Cannabis sativa]
MALAIACGESSPSLFVILRVLNRTMDSIKHNIAEFVNVICSRNNGVDARNENEIFGIEEWDWQSHEGKHIFGQNRLFRFDQGNHLPGKIRHD